MSAAGPASRVRRGLYLLAGLLCVGVGALGAVLPGLPTTIFFIGAAACFTRSSPRLERWVLGLPGVGQLVRDHRAGLGMPRRAKVWAIGSMVGFSALAVVVLDHLLVRSLVVVAVAVGTVVVAYRIPTRERALGGGAPASGDLPPVAGP